MKYDMNIRSILTIYLRILLLSTILIASIYLLSCNSSNDTENGIYWERLHDGKFITNDIERAQKEIPFKIICPTYLPNNLETPPRLVGPLTGITPNNEVGIEITYQTEGPICDGLIRIEKRNVLIALPNIGDSICCDSFNISGNEVVQCTSIEQFSSSDGEITCSRFDNYWRDVKKGITTTVIIYGYNGSESLKIIESMIQQQ